MSENASVPIHRYSQDDSLRASEIIRRREMVFLILSGFFLGTLGMLNVLGVTRFVNLSFSFLGFEIPMILAVGVLPYPITFLCTDLISELYGKARASSLVWMGLLINIWMLFILWLGGVLPGVSAEADGASVFFDVRKLAFSVTAASMVAYVVAQFVDVHVFHFWKSLTKGKHLWLRNNGSTLVSQLVDSVAVILITYGAGGLPMKPNESVREQLIVFIVSGYSFKLLSALADTLPFYVLSKKLAHYLRFPPPGSVAE